MIQRHRGFLSVLLTAGVIVSAGCSSISQPNVIKTHGVYTTISPESNSLDLPGASYQAYHTFAYGMTPAAVVVGFGYDDGYNNRPQAFTLEVAEAATGTVIMTRGGEEFAGMAAVVDLPVRKSGQYKLKLITGKSVYDTWDFTIVGDTAIDGTNKPAAYAKGQFSIVLTADTTPEAFAQYDEVLMAELNNSAEKEYSNAKESIFAQLPPGKVVVQFDLNPDGRISSPKILSNTLDEDVGQFFLHVLQSDAPSKPWPAAAMAAFGNNPRTMQATFYLD